MMREDAVPLLRRMLEIPSPSYHEDELAAYLTEQMTHLGFHSYRDGAGNAIGERGRGRSPTILLLGHMDTVSDPVPVRLEGSRLYGRGAVDAKGALATLICAAAELGDTAAHVIVVGAVEEETPGSRGAHYILDRYCPDAVLIGEPSGWDGVVVGYKGRMGLTYEVTRPSTHSASPNEKAAEVAIEFWNALIGHLAALAGEGGLFYRPSAALCRMEGDIEHALMQITCRTPPGFDFEAFETFLASIRRDASVVADERTPAALMDRSSPVARALVSSIRGQGVHPRVKIKTGTSDMNIVCQRWHAPMAAYGPGDSALDHTEDEHLDLDEYDTAITVLQDALRALTAELTERQSGELTGRVLADMRDAATVSQRSAPQ